MIYMEPSQLGWEPLVASWMEKEYPSNLSPASKYSIQVSLKNKPQSMYFEVHLFPTLRFLQFILSVVAFVTLYIFVML